MGLGKEASGRLPDDVDMAAEPRTLTTNLSRPATAAAEEGGDNSGPGDVEMGEAANSTGRGTTGTAGEGEEASVNALIQYTLATTFVTVFR